MFIALAALALSYADARQAPVSAPQAPKASHADVSRRSRTPPPLTRFGYDTIRIGMAPQDVRGYTLTNMRAALEDCAVLQVKEIPAVEILVSRNVIRRISIGSSSPMSHIRTDRGVGIGSPEAMVARAYHPIIKRSHQYDDAPAAYMTWLPRHETLGLTFETGTDRRVKVIHAGRLPELNYVERCG